MREIRELGGGRLTWQGVITHMEWTHQGDVYIQDINPISNARRAMYRRLFDNLLTNGSAESGAWTVAVGGGVTGSGSATTSQSTEWVADGTYSCKIISTGGVHGADIATSVTIVANVAYSATVKLHVLSGSWRVAINRVDTDAKIVATSTHNAVGDQTINLVIPDTNIFAGAVRFRVTSEGGAGTVYGDAAVLKPADAPADTGWLLDASSIHLYGRKELVDLWGGLSYQAANAQVASDLVLTAWPQPDTSTSGSTRQAAVDPKEDKLAIVFGGYWLTLNWIYTHLTGTAGASTLVHTLAGYQSDYLAAGTIATNALSYTIEDASPLRCGDVLKEIANSGDATKGKWTVGVWSQRQVDYHAIAPQLSYHIRDGHLLQMSGGDIEPWLARPGWAMVDDLPIGPGHAGAAGAQNDPRWRYLEEIEMLPPDNQHSEHWLSYSREAT
jgi:hypothetical protein